MINANVGLSNGGGAGKISIAGWNSRRGEARVDTSSCSLAKTCCHGDRPSKSVLGFLRRAGHILPTVRQYRDHRSSVGSSIRHAAPAVSSVRASGESWRCAIVTAVWHTAVHLSVPIIRNSIASAANLTAIRRLSRVAGHQAPRTTTPQSVGTLPFGACGDNTESKIFSFRARVGLCAVVEDRLSFRSVGGPAPKPLCANDLGLSPITEFKSAIRVRRDVRKRHATSDQ